MIRAVTLHNGCLKLLSKRIRCHTEPTLGMLNPGYWL
jgi:hypothetical protein